MEKLDLTKKYGKYFKASIKPEIVEIEPAQFLAIVGKGDPSEKQFADKIEALYSTAYTLKFACKAKDKDFVVSKLEGLWWFDEKKFANKTMVNTSVEVPRSEWEYRLLIMLPEFITKQDVEKAKETVIEKKGIQLAQQLEYFIMAEGKSIQMLHVGPFSTEPETLKQIGEFADINKLTKNGYHHEIYLSDFRKTEANKLKTILREPSQVEGQPQTVVLPTSGDERVGTFGCISHVSFGSCLKIRSEYANNLNRLLSVLTNKLFVDFQFNY